MNLVRKWLALLVVVLTVAPVYAGMAISPTSSSFKARRIRPNITYEDTVGPQLVLPIVGRAQGGFGAFFKSGVTIMNFRADTSNNVVPQRIRVDFYAADVSNVGATPSFYTLQHYGESWEDFLAEFFTPAKSGLGSLVITAVDANGNLDGEGLLDAVTRIYTAQPPSTGCPQPRGSVSQSLPAFPLEDINATGEAGFLYGLRQDADFRTNIGIVNHDTIEHTFTVIVVPFIDNGTNTTFTVTVPPKSLRHVPLPAGNYGPSMAVEIIANETGFFFNAYGSTVDNGTQDGYTFKANF